MIETLWVVSTRKCNLACRYCVSPSTPVLMGDMSWRPIGSVSSGESLFGFDHDQPGAGIHRRMRRAVVEKTFSRRAEVIRIETDWGGVTCTPDHPWLSGARWRRAGTLAVGDQIRWLASPVDEPGETEAYRRGYFAGISEGDALVGSWPKGERYRSYQYRLALKDTVALDRIERYGCVGLPLRRRIVDCGQPLDAIVSSRREVVEEIETRIASWSNDREYLRGWLAGIFDAEGSFSGSLRISQKPGQTLDRIVECLSVFGFDVVSEPVRANGVGCARVRGGLSEVVRFASLVRPAVMRKFDSMVGASLYGPSATIESIGPAGEEDVVDVTTSTGTFVAAGLASHNCYQGPEHKLAPGLSAYISDEVLQKTLDWAVGWAHDGIRLAWYGGEPLLTFEKMRKWTPAFKRAFVASGRKFHSGVTTNGTLLTSEIMDWLDTNDVGILLSLDGPRHIHDLQRKYATGRPSWDTIPVGELIARRGARLECVWQLDPRVKVVESDLDEILGLGFAAVNFNLNWLEPWPPAAQAWLTDFMAAVARKCAAGKMRNNIWWKLWKAMRYQRMVKPCGTGEHMLAVTPEGWIYPSQEMAFSAVEPGRAPGTAEYYRVGDVFADPVLDRRKLETVSMIRTEDMIIPAGFDCDTCHCRVISVGGCHCRFVGQGPTPAHRFNVPIGYCQSIRAAMAGMLQGALTMKAISPTPNVAGWPQQPQKACKECRG